MIPAMVNEGGCSLESNSTGPQHILSLQKKSVSKLGHVSGNSHEVTRLSGKFCTLWDFGKTTKPTASFSLLKSTHAATQALSHSRECKRMENLF